MAFLTLILPGAAVFVCLIIWIIMIQDWGGFDTDQIPVAVILGVCLLSCILTIVHVRNIPSDTKWDVAWKTNIIALKDNSDIKGHISSGIFVASGQVEEKVYYYCMENTQAGKHLIKVPAEQSYIVETNEQAPQIIAESENYVDKRAEFWEIAPIHKERYIIYVPKGTVDATYKIDME